MATAAQLLDIARAELGTKESPAGSNRVKYNTAYYGREVSGPSYPWCVVFAWWCCDQAGVELPIRTASCSALKAAAQSAGMWVTGNYRPGDIVIYDWGKDGKPDHCGIIETVGGSSVVAIEGNTAVGNDSNGGEVMRRTRTMSQIIGAVRPVYEEASMETQEVQTAQEWAQNAGIMTGYADGQMHLDNTVTRRQLLLVLYRFAKWLGKI